MSVSPSVHSNLQADSCTTNFILAKRDLTCLYLYHPQKPLKKLKRKKTTPRHNRGGSRTKLQSLILGCVSSFTEKEDKNISPKRYTIKHAITLKMTKHKQAYFRQFWAPSCQFASTVSFFIYKNILSIMAAKVLQKNEICKKKVQKYICRT